MATTELKNIFLSASIPILTRNPKYYHSTDVIAIRDAVIALATVILPEHRLVWGGHPSITPLIYRVMDKLELDIQKHVTIYQSAFFEKFYPEDNNKFENIIQTKNLNNKDNSLLLMRETMFKSCKFSAGVFIGGMEGVEDEYELFKKMQANALIVPLASTGAAAQIIYEKLDKKNDRFSNDYAYMSLFQEFILNKI